MSGLRSLLYRDTFPRLAADLREQPGKWLSRLVFLLGPWASFWMVEILNENDVFSDLYAWQVLMNLIWYYIWFVVCRLALGRRRRAAALAAAERIFALLDQPEETADLPGAQALTDVKGEVEARHVSFGYLPGRTVLHDLSLKAEPGQTIAIVGHTGAGKTTIINLLMRFYDVDSGEIRVDGKELHQLTRSSLRRAYAMVLQDTWVFRGTIFENIAYGKEGATREEVIAAAKAARIHDYIMQLPDGYDTIISEDGGNISKGQKQLLTIARAMLYDTQMLILDEATSNVDTNTEQKVQKAMQELMRGKTSFVIAHRLSTIQNADKILVMEHGDVMEQGTHAELMAQKGVYYKLYASQFE